MFYKVIKDNLNHIVSEFEGVNQDVISSVIIKIMNSPVIVLNFDPAKNLII